MLIMEKDEEFEQLIADKRHKEIKAVLSAIATGLKEDKSAEALSKSISIQTKNIEKFIESLKKSDENSDKNVSLYSKEGADILQGLKELKKSVDEMNKPKEWTFKIHRSAPISGVDTGFIESVTAKQTK